MNSKERAFRAIEHEEPDRVPLEGVAWGEWSYPFLSKVLLPYFNLRINENKALNISEKIERVLVNLGIDFRAVSMEPPSSFREKAVYNPLFHYPWGIPVASDTLRDEWGVIRRLNSTRTQSLIIHHPLEGKDISVLDEYEFPDPNAPGRFDLAERLVKKWHEKYAISATWGDSFFSQAWYLRGFNSLIKDMYSNPLFVEKLMDRLLKIFLEACRYLIDIGVDIICIADDVAMQDRMIIAPELWRRYIKPRMKAIVDYCKRRGVYVLYHTDGNCEDIIPDLIEMGIDILNPIQPESMDPAKIKRTYGDRLVLSGTISVQRTLPRGSVNDVKKEVMERIESCAPGGGFILAPSNQVLLDTKIENFIALYQFAKKYGRYPLTGVRR